MQTTKTLFLAVAATVLGAAIQSPLAAAPASAPPPPPPSSFEQFIAEAKNPTDWLSWGADIRARNEYYNEIVTFTRADPLHEQDVFRFRGRLWASVKPIETLSLNARVSAEPRTWMKPSFVGVHRGETGTEWRYGLIDNLNIKWDRVLDQPLSITAGRQDIFLGDFYDWWLVADGTPGDGSWSFFLDSVRATYELADLKTKIDVIYIHQNAHPDEWIPTFGNSSEYMLVEQRERGVILYGSNKSIQNMQLDGYFIYKHDDREDFVVRGVRSIPGDNADIYTAGGKITGTPSTHWLYSIEGAYQFGQKEDRILGIDRTRDISAYGGKAKLTYLLRDKLNNQFHFMGEFLSGDDPNTDNDEMFDLLWGRWPRWSELYIYSYIVETGGKIAQMNNLGRVGAGWSITPVKGLTFSAVYNALFAPEQTPSRALTMAPFSQDGNFRGHYGQAVLKYQFNKHLSGHLWAEGVWQGDYYNNRDLLSFLRAEVMFTF
jgi:hypothetical protein